MNIRLTIIEIAIVVTVFSRTKETFLSKIYDINNLYLKIKLTIDLQVFGLYQNFFN